MITDASLSSRGGVGDAGLLDEGQGVVGAVGHGEPEERDLPVACTSWYTSSKAGISVMHGVQVEAKKFTTVGVPRTLDSGTSSPSKVVKVASSKVGTSSSGTRVIGVGRVAVVVGVVGEEHHGGRRRRAGRARCETTSDAPRQAGGLGHGADGNAATCSATRRHRAVDRGAGRGSVVDDPHDGGTSCGAAAVAPARPRR